MGLNLSLNGLEIERLELENRVSYMPYAGISDFFAIVNNNDKKYLYMKKKESGIYSLLSDNFLK